MTQDIVFQYFPVSTLNNSIKLEFGVSKPDWVKEKLKGAKHG
jgi:hypothetical protein